MHLTLKQKLLACLALLGAGMLAMSSAGLLSNIGSRAAIHSIMVDVWSRCGT